MVQAKRSLSPLALILILSSVFFAIFLAISGALFLMRAPGGPQKGAMTTSLFGGGSVGVIEISGVILDSKKVLRKLDRFEEDDQIKAVVVRLNSPGGGTAPSEEIYKRIRDYKKPVVASMGSVAASGAYYIACGTKKIFANAGTLTGSIGVIMEFANLGKLYDWAKIQRYAIKTGKYKDIGAEYRDLTPEERSLLQNLVNDVLAEFKRVVAVGRKLTMAQVTAIADGRIFSGTQAKAVHLVDEIGTLQEAIAEAGKLGKIKGKPPVVYIEKQKRSFLDYFVEDSAGGENSHSSLDLLKILGRMITQVSSLNGEQGISEGPLTPVPGIYWLWNQGQGR